MASKRKISLWFFVQPLIFTALLWLIFGIDHLLGLDLTRYSLEPRNVKALYGILTFPLLHGSLEHIASNTISIFVLLTAVRYFFPALFTKVFIVSFLIPGVLTWIIGRPSLHLGASGMIYALAAFLFVSGVVRSNRYLLALSLLVVFLYGNMVWYVFPIEDGISWEGHLSGAVTGFILGVFFKDKEPTHLIKEKEYFTEDEENPLIGDLWKGQENTLNNSGSSANEPRIIYHIKKKKDIED